MKQKYTIKSPIWGIRQDGWHFFKFFNEVFLVWEQRGKWYASLGRIPTVSCRSLADGKRKAEDAFRKLLETALEKA